MQIARWALICAALLGAFQAWLWVGQGSLVSLFGAIALAMTFLAVALLPNTRLAVTLNRAWTLPRASGESERHCRFKIVAAWLVVVGVCVLGCIGVRVTHIDQSAGIVLRVFGFVAALMALQSLLVGVVPSGQQSAT
jgi:hypothetical protein